MTIQFKGILAVAATKDDAVAAYVAAATGKSVAYMKSESGDMYATAGEVKHDPIGDKPLVQANAPTKVKFASESSSVDTHISVCLDGCQKFILSDSSDLKRCPSCSASLEEVTANRVHDVIFGSESDDLSNVHEPLFCGTVEQAQAFVQALRTGQQVSVSGTTELKYDPFTGAEQLRSCSGTSEFDGEFHQYTCAANCSAPITVSSADDVVFCAHCSAPLCENESMKISRINTKVTAFAPSLSAAAEAFRQIVLGQGKAAVHDKAVPEHMFVSSSRAQFNPFTGDSIASCGFESMSSAASSGDIEKVHTHVLKCSDGCGYMISSSSDAVFCSECMAPLVEPSDEDVSGLDGTGLEMSEEDDSLGDLESDLAELDDDSFEDESGDKKSCSGDDEEDEFGEDQELDFDDEDDESLSADDYDFESMSEEDEIEFDDEEDDSDSDEEDDEDFDEDDESLSGDEDDSDDEDEDEDDEDSMLEDDELDDIDLDSGDSDEESESSVISSVSAVEAAKSIGELNAQSLSLVYNGNDKWFAFHNDTPLATLSFTALSNAINDEVRAKSLFFGTNLTKTISASAAEHGVEETLNTFGFTPVNFDVKVSEVCRARAESAANARVEQINAEIESISSQRIERNKAAVSAALLGLTGGFWRDSNPVADALVNKIAATGVSMSAARDMVTASFRKHGPDLCANLFSRSEYLCNQSLSAQEEITRAIEEAASGTGNIVEESLSSIGKPVTRPHVEEPKTVSVSSANNADAPDDYAQRVKSLL